MSRAFVKEGEGEDTEMPERPVSPHPNFVTKRGLALMDREIESLRKALGVAHKNADRAEIARLSRDLRYWAQRRSTVVLVELEPDAGSVVGFGSKVVIERDDGKGMSFRIVGEDEADPKAGYVSYVAPIARALIGAKTGDIRPVPGGEAEIIEIDNGVDAELNADWPGPGT
ncbi:MAG: transcription elongation factor GreA [Parvibaculaceae bacterium]|nr:transcription elongation factor GreA [Parvibaculaceae bacterium]